MPSYEIHVWRKVPFIRFLLPLIAGILLQWELQLPVEVYTYVLLLCLIVTAAFFFIPYFQRFRFSFFSGLVMGCIFFSIAAVLVWNKDIRNDKNWFGNFYTGKQSLIVTLEEPPIEKTKSVKADATVVFLSAEGKKIATTGKIIVYFQKDSSLQQLNYGSQIVFTKPLQEIKNSGNPGGFNYKRFSLFQGITHQAYLKPGEFVILNGKNQEWLNKFLFTTRKKVVSILRKYIHGVKVQGLAEALLIGYKNDLDRTLVQSYTNTGVVHIIAISGMHLALIYWLLLRLSFPLRRNKKFKWLSPVIIIAGLWLFSLLAGAQASVLRSAVMFTCIVAGENLFRKTSIFNTLAVSAFILLCYDPYWLWDVGFQLSYAAVLSIVIFMQPIYNLFYVKNKALDFIWKLNAVTIAAQILTVPVSIYHFHQFPNYFLLTNFIAVPLSSVILLGEIVLCTVSFIPVVAAISGKILSWLIGLMNSYIERIESLPYSLWDGLYISIPQTVLLVIAVAGISYWLMEKMKAGLKVSLLALLGFIFLRTVSLYDSAQQQKIIVYNVPQRRAIDLIDGRNYSFVGDSDLLEDDFLRNFHLKPSRISNRVTPFAVNEFWRNDNYLMFHNKKILLVKESISFSENQHKPDIDLLVISKNSKFYISNLVNSFNIKQIVFDGSNSPWKINYWIKDCDSLHIPYHDVNEKGAFVMNLR